MVSFEIHILAEIVRKASLIIASEGDRTIARSRSSSDYTTVTDLRVENFIKDKLIKLSPESHVIAEESFDNDSIRDWHHSAFILDPLDGTINFRHSYNASAISLAYFKDGYPLYSVVFDPFRDEMFLAERGCGATLNGKKINVSRVSTLEEALIGFGTTPYDKSGGLKMLEITKKIYARCQDVRRMGAAALDLAYVACGRLDAFFEMDLKPWDLYGGMLIVEEAGGTVSDWMGAKIEGLGKIDVLAANGSLHEDMLNLIQR